MRLASRLQQNYDVLVGTFLAVAPAFARVTQTLAILPTAALSQDCLAKHLYSSAVFFADKLVSMSEVRRPA